MPQDDPFGYSYAPVLPEDDPAGYELDLLNGYAPEPDLEEVLAHANPPPGPFVADDVTIGPVTAQEEPPEAGVFEDGVPSADQMPIPTPAAALPGIVGRLAEEVGARQAAAEYGVDAISAADPRVDAVPDAAPPPTEEQIQQHELAQMFDLASQDPARFAVERAEREYDRQQAVRSAGQDYLAAKAERLQTQADELAEVRERYEMRRQEIDAEAQRVADSQASVGRGIATVIVGAIGGFLNPRTRNQHLDQVLSIINRQAETARQAHMDARRMARRDFSDDMSALEAEHTVAIGLLRATHQGLMMEAQQYDPRGTRHTALVDAAIKARHEERKRQMDLDKHLLDRQKAHVEARNRSLEQGRKLVEMYRNPKTGALEGRGPRYRQELAEQMFGRDAPAPRRGGGLSGPASRPGAPYVSAWRGKKEEPPEKNLNPMSDAEWERGVLWANDKNAASSTYAINTQKTLGGFKPGLSADERKYFRQTLDQHIKDALAHKELVRLIAENGVIQKKYGLDFLNDKDQAVVLAEIAKMKAQVQKKFFGANLTKGEEAIRDAMVPTPEGHIVRVENLVAVYANNARGYAHQAERLADSYLMNDRHRQNIKSAVLSGMYVPEAREADRETRRNQWDEALSAPAAADVKRLADRELNVLKDSGHTAYPAEDIKRFEALEKTMARRVELAKKRRGATPAARAEITEELKSLGWLPPEISGISDIEALKAVRGLLKEARSAATVDPEAKKKRILGKAAEGDVAAAHEEATADTSESRAARAAQLDREIAELELEIDRASAATRPIIENALEEKRAQRKRLF